MPTNIMPPNRYLPDPGLQADIEAVESSRARARRRRKAMEDRLAFTETNLDLLAHAVRGIQRQLKALEIETVCAICHKRISGPVGQPPEQISHGLCSDCAEKIGYHLGIEWGREE